MATFARVRRPAAPASAAHVRRDSDGRRTRGRPLLDALGIFVVVGGLAALLSLTSAMQRFDWAIYDAWIDLLPLQVAQPPIVIAIDDRSIEEIGAWPWPRRTYARLIDRLAEAGVERIGLDVLLADPSVSTADDAAMAAAIRRFPTVYMPVVIDERNAYGQLVEVLPSAAFIEAGARLGHVHVEASDDGVVRGVWLWQGVDSPHWPHMALALARQRPPASPASADDRANEPMSMANVRADPVLFRFVPHAGSLPRVSFVDVLRRGLPRDLAAGRTVFVGMTAASGADTVATPVTREGRPMAGVEFNANLYAALRGDGILWPLSTNLNALLAVLFTGLPLLLLPTLGPRIGLLATLLLGLAPLLFSFALLALGDRWYPPFAAMVCTALTYPLWSWRRLDQTLRSVRGEIAALGETAAAARLTPDAVDRDQAARFVAALLPAELDERGEPRPVEKLDSAAERWLAHYRTTTRERRATTTDSIEVLTRDLDALHDSLARQNATLAVAERSLTRMRDGVILLGDFGRVLLVNDAARNLLGLDENAAGNGVLDLLRGIRLADGSIWRQRLRALYVDGHSDTIEARLERRGGVGTGELLVSLARHEGGAVIGFVDISRLRQAERAHRETLSFLSHDLRSPIVSSIALTRSLREQTKEEATRATLERIQQYAQRSLENAEQFLQLARIENEPALQLYEVDLLGVVENAAAQLVDQATARGCRIAVHTASEEGIWVQANGEFIERALINLIGNALKYGPANDTIDVRVDESDSEAFCEVRDHGAGIPSEELPRLFAPYYQGPEHRARRDGVGLGLRFVHVVAERHQGRVEVESSAEGDQTGTTFRLVLPKLALPDAC